MKAPYDIPAINNEFEVLCEFLGIADDNDQQRSQVEVLGQKDGISRFRYNEESYAVARMNKLPEVKIAREFNSGWYAIQAGSSTRLDR